MPKAGKFKTGKADNTSDGGFQVKKYDPPTWNDALLEKQPEGMPSAKGGTVQQQTIKKGRA